MFSGRCLAWFSSERIYSAGDLNSYRYPQPEWMEFGDSYQRIRGRIADTEGNRNYTGRLTVN